MDKKILVAYFSATGTTASRARQIAQATGGALYEITPAEKYTAADLDWENSRSRSSLEMNDPASRPAIKGTVEGIGEYDVVFLGYPIWWDLVPRAVNTFIESTDLKGKRVIPFATSGSSTITNSVAELRKAYPDIEWDEGRLLNGMSPSAVESWAKSAME